MSKSRHLHLAPCAVFLDLDGTLLDHLGASRTAIERQLAEHSVDSVDSADAYLLWISLERRYFQDYLDGKLTFSEQRRARVRRFSRELGLNLRPSESDAWFEEYRIRYESAWALFPDAQVFTDNLRKVRTPVAIVTNGDEEQQRRKVTHLGLEDFALVTSSQIGYRKPDPRLFRAAVERVGANPVRSVFFGDDFEADIVGARSAGMPAVWLDRVNATDNAADPPRIASFNDVSISACGEDDAHD